MAADGPAVSGGSLGYLYDRVESAAERLKHEERIMAKVLGAHLSHLAGVLMAVEWVLSNDWDWEEQQLDRRIMELVGPGRVLQITQVEADNALAHIELVLAEAKRIINLNKESKP